MARLQELVGHASQVETVRRPTKPTYGSKQRRLQGKAIRSQVKATRGRVQD
jgi:ribosome-associated protein